MRKGLSIALIVAITTIAAPAAQADTPLGQRIIAQENAMDLAGKPTAPTYGLGAADDTAAAEALGARSEALNQEYGLGSADDTAAAEALGTRSQALNQKYGLGAADDTAGEALGARSEALNQEYGLGAAPDTAAAEARGTRSEAAVNPIVAQERGRTQDTRLFGPTGAAPVQVVGPADAFDLADAGIGGAVALALALLAAAGTAARGYRRHGSAGAASAES